MELTPSIRFQVCIRGRTEDSSRNREKERTSDLAGHGREGENCLLKIERKQDKCEALAVCKELLKRGRKFCFSSVSFLVRRRCHEPKQKDTDAGKWFFGEVVEIPLLEAYERKWGNT